MRKIAGLIRQDTGVGLYRIGQPILFLDNEMGTKSKITPFTGTNKVYTIGVMSDSPAWSDQTLIDICKDADIIWSNMIYSDEETLKILNIREMFKTKWVIDIDDDMYNVPATNPMAGKVKEILPLIERGLKLADGLTVSVPTLKKRYQHLNSNIHINPNGQDIKFWEKLQKGYKPKLHPKIRIGWRGAAGHDADLRLIEPAIKAIRKDFDVELVTLGATNPPFEVDHKVDWVGCLDFPEQLMKLNLDIALVPLVDSQYNKCKSSIAVQEFGILGIPVVASPTENQKDFPILYASNSYEWYENIAKLIKNKKFRQNMGQNLQNHIKKYYDVSIFTPDLYNFFKKLQRKDLKPE